MLDMGPTFKDPDRRRKELNHYINDLVSRPERKEGKGRRIESVHLRMLLIEKDEGLRNLMKECISSYSAPASVDGVASIREAAELITGGVRFDRIIVDGNPRKDDLTVQDLLNRTKPFRKNTFVIIAYNSDAEARSSEFNLIEEVRTQTFSREITNDVEKAILDGPNYSDVVYVDYKTRISGRAGREYIRDPIRAVRARLKCLIGIKKRKFMELKRAMENQRKHLEQGDNNENMG